MKPHNDGHYFVPGSRQTGRYEPRGFMVGSYAKPTLTEQGIATWTNSSETTTS